MDTAIMELRYARGEYENFREITDDIRKLRNINFSIEWGPEDNLEPESIWESLPSAFDKSCPKPDIKAICDARIPFQRCMLREQIMRIFRLVADHQPNTVDQSQQILERLEKNFEHIRLCAEQLLTASFNCKNKNQSPSFTAERLSGYAIDAVSNMTNRMPDNNYVASELIKIHAAKPNTESSTQRVGRTIRLGGSEVPHQIVAHHLAEVMYAGEVVRIKNLACYTLNLPPNYYGPGIVEAATADILAQYMPVPNRNPHTPGAYPQIQYAP